MKKNKIIPGDLVFQIQKQEKNIDNNFLKAIQESYVNQNLLINTDKLDKFTLDNLNLINHVGLAISANEIIEAKRTVGVVKTSISNYLQEGIINLIASIKNNFDIQNSINCAIKQLNKPYNIDFNPNGEGLYCSQLITLVYPKYFKLEPMNFRNNNGKIIPFWKEYYKNINKNIPENKLGSHPAKLLINNIEIFEHIYLIN